MEISSGNIKIQFDTLTLNLIITTPGNMWEQDNYNRARIDFNERTVYFKDIKKISHEYWESGVGQGIVSKFEINEFAFKTKIWIDSTRHDLHFEFISLREETNSIRKVIWPGAMVMQEMNEQCYTVFPMRQGILIPNNWPKKSEAVYEGRYYNMAYYMPWWGQVENGSGFITIAETPWDGGCDLDHPPGGPTAMSAAWYPSLGKIGYRRIMKYSFIENCDYNVLCKSYRKHVEEHGDVLTLRQKILRNPKLEQLIGSNIVHEGICVHIKPESYFYNKDAPAKNDYHTSFDTRAEQLKELKQKGADKVYLHLDGWEVRGYDNLQPDVLPPCEKAGGWPGLINLADTCRELGYLFTLHDNYTFIYNDAPSYDPDQLICDENGNIMSECVWFGGEQGFMCSHLTKYYFTRNHEKMLNEGLHLDGVYLDGFSASPLYECMHEDHIMSRKDCVEKRRECLAYASGRGYLVSSEEATDAYISKIDLVHHTPYEFNGREKCGIPVPLFNLVYHDCLIIPWYTNKGAYEMPKTDSVYLHGLLNAGVPYLSIAAGEKQIEMNKIMCELHERAGMEEMLRHEFVDGNLRVQRTYFSGGIVVEVNFDTEEYSIQSRD